MPSGYETAREHYERLRGEILAFSRRWPAAALGEALEELVQAHEAMRAGEPASVRVPRSRYRPFEFDPLPPAPSEARLTGEGVLRPSAMGAADSLAEQDDDLDLDAMRTLADVPLVGAMPDMVSYATAKALADAFDDAIAAATREPWQMLAVSPRRPWWKRLLRLEREWWR